MKRRQFVQYTGAGLLAGLGLSLVDRLPAQAQSGAVSIQYLGHTCFLFTGDGRRILVNPFRPVGCTAGYSAPQVGADLVMISSRLLDEGAVEGLPGNPRILFEPGVYDVNGLQVNGIAMDHDDVGGRRFGTNVAWRWVQGGVNILHLGGAAAPITTEQQILMGRPDVLLVPVGNGPKAFTPEEAQAAIQLLNPKLVIPTHFRTAAADAATCDILPIDNFLALMGGTPVQQVGNSISVAPGDLPGSTQIRVMSYA
ncbi:MAG: MBL fold metallo-hydrolase [Leptolyngbya sp. IPPAS B-1204]|uniref:MBL fold metallo-hydrolase n=1 Tax=Leptolyngbya sp. NK1-12 TaxID=2547451 RepID=A0AA96WIW7_9CYAN|nr:MBL fold metallo-hydrolase [Leptolyngbya sp. NK1-12]MBF2046462.1 MBL fold metallo-hydrolase [Elainella sp. C42_A2020_010]RNJ70176.1 MAG: Zn-dependent hydrolase [Leptolyngbya sp. IPPAS B-1204]WNZ25969.1 MBL fold metallo-hydrolase [Leptolyngbya sp. NK1-12]